MAGLSVAALLSHLSKDLSKDREQRLARERREALLATLGLASCRQLLAETIAEVRALEQRRAALSDAEERYERTLAEKTGWMKKRSAPELAAVLEMAHREGALKDFRRQLDEALAAGYAALGCLEHAASGEGRFVVRPLSIGPFAHAQREMRLDHVHRNAADARLKLARFRRELEDVRGRDAVSVELHWDYPRLPDLLSTGMGDAVLDQVRIHESYMIADATADRLRAVLKQLDRERERTQKALEQAQSRRERLIVAWKG